MGRVEEYGIIPMDSWTQRGLARTSLESDKVRWTPNGLRLTPNGLHWTPNGLQWTPNGLKNTPARSWLEFE